jgi:ABC-2 type transport system ATP-binding protein
MCDRVAIIKEGKLVQVETIDNLTKHSFKKITLTYEEAINPEFGLEGVIEQQTNGNDVRMLYSGDIKILLARIQELPLKDIRIEEPSLDEILMHYYE